MIVYFYLNKKYLKLYGRSDSYFVDHLASLNRNGNAQKQIIGDFKITRRWVLIPVPNEGAVGGGYLPENVPEYMPPPRSWTVSMTAPRQSGDSGVAWL